MTKSFDDILKEGKGKAGGPSSKSKKWKKHVNSIMEELHKLNTVYGNDKAHHIKVESAKCKNCSIVSYILAVKDLDNKQKITRFHKSKWVPLGKGSYYCNKCKKK